MLWMLYSFFGWFPGFWICLSLFSHEVKPWGPPILLYNGYRVIPGGKATGAKRWPPTPSSAEVKERVKLYIYSPSGVSLSVPGWTLPLRDEEKVLAILFKPRCKLPITKPKEPKFFAFREGSFYDRRLNSRDCRNWRRYSPKDRASLSPRAVKDSFRSMFSLHT